MVHTLPPTGKRSLKTKCVLWVHSHEGYVTCWRSIGNEGVNLGVPLRKTTRDGLWGSFLHSLLSTRKTQWEDSPCLTFHRSSARCGAKPRQASSGSHTAMAGRAFEAKERDPLGHLGMRISLRQPSFLFDEEKRLVDPGMESCGKKGTRSQSHARFSMGFRSDGQHASFFYQSRITVAPGHRQFTFERSTTG